MSNQKIDQFKCVFTRSCFIYEKKVIPSKFRFSKKISHLEGHLFVQSYYIKHNPIKYSILIGRDKNAVNCYCKYHGFIKYSILIGEDEEAWENIYQCESIIQILIWVGLDGL